MSFGIKFNLIRYLLDLAENNDLILDGELKHEFVESTKVKFEYICYYEHNEQAAVILGGKK